MTPLQSSITEAVEAFAANDLAYSDAALIVIDPAAQSATLLDPDPDDDIDAIIEAHPELDYVDVMDLVASADAADPGRWKPDTDAIASLAAEYPAS